MISNDNALDKRSAGQIVSWRIDWGMLVYSPAYIQTARISNIYFVIKERDFMEIF